MNFKKIELRQFTTIKIGGTANHFLFCSKIADVASVLRVNGNCKILGNGSNLLVADTDFSEPIIKLDASFKYIQKVKDNCLDIGGAVLVKELLQYCVVNHVGSLSFLAGIPATIGGCVFMNAGSAGLSIGELVDEIEIVTDRGVEVLKAEDITFSYRQTSLPRGVIVRVRLRVFFDKDIKEEICKGMMKRAVSQDLSLPSCGCVFKNHGQESTGKLIDMCGLKGLSKNDARISVKHGNFIVNCGKASYNDVDYLISVIKESVYSKFGVTLEEEVVRWV